MPELYDQEKDIFDPDLFARDVFDLAVREQHLASLEIVGDALAEIVVILADALPDLPTKVHALRVARNWKEQRAGWELVRGGTV